MRFHQNNLLALSATPSKPKIDYTKFVCNFNGDSQWIFHTSYNDYFCGVSWIEDVLLDGQPYQKDYATLYWTYDTLARSPGGGAATQIVDTAGGTNPIHTIEIKFKEGFEFNNSDMVDGAPTLKNYYLTSIEFQDNITQVIATGLFKNCRQLEEINWNNVKLKGSYGNIFYGCVNVKEIDFSTCMDRSNPGITAMGGLMGYGVIPSNTTQLTKIVMPMGAEDINTQYLTWAGSDTSAQYPNSLAGTFYYNEEGNYSMLLHYLSPTWAAVPMKF